MWYVGEVLVPRAIAPNASHSASTFTRRVQTTDGQRCLHQHRFKAFRNYEERSRHLHVLPGHAALANNRIRCFISILLTYMYIIWLDCSDLTRVVAELFTDRPMDLQIDGWTNGQKNRSTHGWIDVSGLSACLPSYI